MLLILWSPWTPKAHELRITLSNGAEFRKWTLLPGPNGLDWVQGMNLPALAVVTPVELGLRRGSGLRDARVIFFGLWLVGFLCWGYVGRFVDDIVLWRKSHHLPSKSRADLTFAMLAAPSAVFLAVAFTMGDQSAPVIGFWGFFWVVLSCAALLFRVWQFVPKKPLVLT